MTDAKLRQETKYLITLIKQWIEAYEIELVELEESYHEIDKIDFYKKHSYIKGKIDTYRKMINELNYIMQTTK